MLTFLVNKMKWVEFVNEINYPSTSILLLYSFFLQIYHYNIYSVYYVLSLP